MLENIWHHQNIWNKIIFVINGGNIKITENFSEKAFQSCLQIISTPKIKEDMTFSKTETKKFNLSWNRYLKREREEETKSIFGVNGFEFYEVY